MVVNLFTRTDSFGFADGGPGRTRPSPLTARLQVIGVTCDFASPLPATRLHSDRQGFDCVGGTGHGFFMMRDAPRVLRKATEVNVGFR